MSEPLTWTSTRKKLSELDPRPDNPRFIEDKEGERLIDSYMEFGQPIPLLANPDGTLNDGHQRLKKWIEKFGPNFEVDLRIPSRPLTQKEWQKLTVYLHRGTTGQFDFEMLKAWKIDEEIVDWGIEGWEINLEGADEVDYEEEWKGMPDYEQEDLSPERTLKVHFRSSTDVVAFAELVGQKITEKTHSLWFPESEKLDLTKFEVIDES